MTRTSKLGKLLRRSAVVIALLPSLAQGASGPKKLPVCNSKNLRDVNIYGSVLPGSPIPAVTAPPAPPPAPQITRPIDGGPPPPPVPSPAPDKTSARADPRAFESC
jgi:hypothetical protein